MRTTETATFAVRLFARARDLAGTDQAALSVPKPARVGDVRRALLAAYPALAPLGPHLLAAVNSDYATDADELAEGSELAFFPPVSGG